MKNRFVVIGGFVLLFVAVSLGAYLFLSQSRSQATVSPEVSPVSPTPEPVELAIWTDEAGFTFQYPKELVTNKHEEDNDSYAHVELTNAAHPGRIIVWARDAAAGVTDVAGWVKKEKAFLGANVIDTTLAGTEGKKILLAAQKMVIVGTVDENIVFSVEGTLTDADYWSKVHDTITNSFEFTPDPAAAAAGSSPGGAAGGSYEEAVDETEVIE